MTWRDPVTDLARERRLRALDARMRDLIATGDPELETRTRAVLAGELAAPDLTEEAMALHDRNVNLRLPHDLLERAEHLAPALAADPTLAAAGRGATRATVLRLAIVHGLNALEAQFGKARKGKGGAR